ncbi:MAG: substrate-binding domain-containing protein [Planctomycetota bacterium]
MTGAQIATELTESWLHEAKSYRFQTIRPRNPSWSEVGFQALAAGECDLACTDRTLSARELQEFGDRRIEGYRVAFYGYALYVHPDNPLDSIFAKHINLVFQQRISDWKELAGQGIVGLEGPIQLFGPLKTSRGGMILMRRAKIWFTNPTWQPLETDAEILARVADDPLAMGFASVGYDEGVRALGIRMRRTDPPAFPSLEEIESERYGLAKVIYVYMASPPSPEANAAIEYLFSERGRQAIEATDTWPIPWERAAVTRNP